LEEGAKFKLINMSGHKSTGGMRCSCYNAMPLEGMNELVKFMRKFQKENPDPGFSKTAMKEKEEEKGGEEVKYNREEFDKAAEELDVHLD